LGDENIALFQCDLSSAESLTSLFDRALSHFGKIDVFIHSAGVYEEQEPVEGLDVPTFMAQWRRIMDLNLTGVAHLMALASKYFANRIPPTSPSTPQAAIIAIGSRGAYRGEPNAWAYGSSKAALHALIQSAAITLGPHGVVCAGVAPGFTNTPMAEASLSGKSGEAIMKQSPWGRVALPEEVAHVVECVARFWDTAFVSGTIVDVNGASYVH